MPNSEYSPSVGANDATPKDASLAGKPKPPVKPAGLVRTPAIRVAPRKNPAPASRGESRVTQGTQPRPFRLQGKISASNTKNDPAGTSGPATPSSSRNSSIQSETAAPRRHEQKPAASKGTVSVKPGVTSWKAKYDEQLVELQQLRSENEMMTRDIEIRTAEHKQKLAESERLREEAVARADLLDDQFSQYQEQNVNLQANLEELSTQAEEAANLIEQLQSQATLTGELQTELNGLRNVRVPQLEQENIILKQEIRKLLEDAEDVSSTRNASSPSVHSSSVATYRAYYPGAKSPPNHEQDRKQYISQLEQANESIKTMYAEVVFEHEDLKTQFADLQSIPSHLVLENTEMALDDGEPRSDSMRSSSSTAWDGTADHKGSPISGAKRILRVVNMSTISQPTASTLSGIVASVHTEPTIFQESGSVTSEIIGEIPIECTTPPKLALTAITTVAINSTNPPTAYTPQPPLDRDLQVTITIEPTERAKLTLLKRLKTITTKGSSFKINGPPSIAKALADGMEAAYSRALSNEAKVVELQQIMWANVEEIQRLKDAKCSKTQHRNLVDDLAAMEMKLQMQDMLLADNGRKLARLMGEKADE